MTFEELELSYINMQDAYNKLFDEKTEDSTCNEVEEYSTAVTAFLNDCNIFFGRHELSYEEALSLFRSKSDQYYMTRFLDEAIIDGGYTRDSGVYVNHNFAYDFPKKKELL